MINIMNKLNCFCIAILLLVLYLLLSKNKLVTENFGDGLLYGWGRYNPDYNTVYNQGCLERRTDSTTAGYSSAKNDNKDFEWIRELPGCNKKVVLFPKSSCGSGDWIIPKIVDSCKLYRPDKFKSYLCPDSCDKCEIEKVGSILEDRLKPRGLFTTSLLAKELNER
jgi:hypothetical protein